MIQNLQAVYEGTTFFEHMQFLPVNHQLSNVLKSRDVKLHHIYTYFGYSTLFSDAEAKGIRCRSLYI